MALLIVDCGTASLVHAHLEAFSAAIDLQLLTDMTQWLALIDSYAGMHFHMCSSLMPEDLDWVAPADKYCVNSWTIRSCREWIYTATSST